MTKLKLFIFICFCALSTITQAQQAPYTLQLSDVTFSDGEITDYIITTEKNIIIPDNFDGVDVTSIGAEAFRSNQLTQVSIGNSVESIGDYAFYYNDLTEVIIPNSVNSIGEYAFYDNDLTEVIIPNSVRSIGNFAFYGNKLTEVIIPNSVESIGEYAFYDNDLTEVIIPNSVRSIGNFAFYGNKLTEVIIPNSVNSIGEYAFYDNDLTEVIIPNSVRSIGNFAFYNNKLTEVIIPNSVESIGSDAFRYNDLTEVIIPNSVKSIGNSAFYGNKLTEVIIGNSVLTIGDGAFRFNQLTEVIIPNSVKSIGLAAFEANQLTEVSIGNHVTSIGKSAFEANRLTEVIIPNSVKSIGVKAFQNNTGLTSFNLPTHYQGYSYSWSNGKKSGDEITDFALSYELDEDSKGNAVDFTISYTLDGGTNAANNPADYTVETATITLADASKDGYTFEGWYSEAAFTNQVTEIATGSTGDISLYAKYSDEYTLQLSDVTFSHGEITDYTNATEKNIIIPDNFNDVAVETIGKDAFKDNELTNVIIPNSVRSIGNYAFYDNQLTEVIIGNSVNSIGESAFAGNQLTEVSIGNSVESIGNHAFFANRLTEVSIPNSVESIGISAFCLNQLTEVIIPNSVTSIGGWAFSSNRLTEVSIGNSVKIIEDAAFSLNKLTQVSIPNYVTSIGQDAFYGNDLTEVSIPNSVNSIGDRAFASNRLTHVIIGNSVTSIGRSAFSSNQLTNVSIPNSVTSIGEYAFHDNHLTHVIIGDSVTSIGKNAFTVNTGLTSFNLPTHYQGYSYSWSNSKKSGDEITDFTLSYELDEDSKGNAVDFTISYTLDGGTNDANNPADYTVETATITLADASKTGRTFKGWYSEAAFTNQVTEIATGSTGDISLYAKYSDEYTLQLSDVIFSNGEITDYIITTEKNIIIPDNFNDVAVETIGKDAFKDNELTNVIIPNSVTSIGNYAFRSNQLTQVIIPNSVKSIGEYAFSGNQLTEVIIPNSVKSIGDYAFYENKLTEVIIGNSVETIGKSAFRLNQLTEVIIPNSVKSIGFVAFSYNDLTEVSIPNSVKIIGNGAFYNNKLTEVIIPNSVNSIGDAAFRYNDLTQVIIPNSVNSIGYKAFFDNPGLTSFNLPTHYQGYSYPWSNGKKSGDEITDFALSYELDEDSKGDAVDFTISYTLDGGTNAANNPADYTVETATITLADASKDGYTFEGWYSDAAFTADNEVTEIATGSTGDISLYAKYSDEYTLQLSDVDFSDGEITNYTNTTEKNIIIPDNFNDVAVTSIGENAFYANQLTEVIIPNSVRSIGKNAFSDNTGLTSFNLPTHYQGYSYSWSNGKKSGDEITDFALSYVLDEDSKGDAVDFTISYTLNGGTNSNKNPANYTIETETIILADASKTGRTFEGWYSEAAFTNQVTEIATGSTGDISLYAKYSDEYTLQLSDVTFSDGEIIDYTNTTEKNIIIPDNFDGVAVTFIGEGAFQNNELTQVSIGNSVTSIGKNAFSDNTGLTSFNLPTHYQGYSYSWSNGKKSGDEITDFALSYVLDEDSKGDAVDFTISYTLNGGTNSNKNPANYTIETETIILADASKDGYTFEGWYSDAAFTADNEVTEIATGSTGPKEFFAKFSDAITYDISYTLDGGTNAANNPAKYTVKTETITLADASKTGRTFKGWYSEAAFTNQVTEIATGSTGDISLYAKYSDEYTLQLSDVDFSHGEITDYTNTTEKNIIIPDNFNDVAVTSIGEGAFRDNQLTEVIIPNSVNSIGEGAFQNNQLTQVIIPNSVNSIGESAFSYNDLTQVIIPDSVNSIGESAFSYNDLTEVIIPDSVNSIGESAFSYNDLTEVIIPDFVNSIGNYAFFSNDLTEVIIPTSVDSIGNYAFSSNKLTEVSIGNSVLTIGDGAFYQNKLTEVIIPASVDSIGKDAFKDNQLTEVSIGNSVNSIGEGAFRNNQLTYVIIPASVDSIGNYAFSSNKLTEVSIGNSVLTIGDGAFYENQLTEVIIPASVDSIGNYAFSSNKLTEVSIGNSVLTIGDGAFYENQLTEVIIPASVDSIGKDAFKDNKLTEVSIGNSVLTIGEGAFAGNQLTEVIIPNSVISIGKDAFKDNKLTEVSIGNSVLTIGDGAFYENQLTYVIIPNSVISIGKDAFKDNKLTEVSIGNSVNSIGEGAFRNNQLTYVIIPNSVTSIGEDTFYNNQLTNVSIPNSVTSIGGSAFASNRLTHIIIGNSVTSIGESAFASNRLTRIIIGNSVTSIGKNAFSDNTGLTSFNLPTHYQGYSYSWSNGKKSGDEITDFALSYVLDEDSKGDAVDFTITYTIDGGTNAANNPADYTVETPTITLEDASKVGYTFEGWYSDAAFTADNEVTEIATGSTGDVVLFAKFDAITYDITYTLDGGTNAANNPADYTVETTTITLADASKDGYTFGGWYSDAAFTADNEVTEIATGSTGPKEFFAKFSETYNITYTLDGGTNAANNPADYTVETATITLADASKDGYTFGGWYSEAAFTNQVTEIATGSTGPKEFFAKFSETYNITYTLDGGTNAANNPADYTVETATITLAEASKDGYTFGGWYSEATFTTDNEVTEIATGSTGPKEFFAKFSDAITYDITYILDGGTNAANNPADYTVETATITLAEASKEGYTFEGWYSDATFTTDNEVTEIATGSTGPKEFFAKFSDAITYDITYILDGGTNAANNPADYTVETATITLAEASKDGYTFEGWYSEATFTTDNEVTEIATGSTGPKEFFAKFSEIYIITYTLDGGTNDANNPADYTVETATITLADASKDGYTFEGWYSDAAFTADNEVTEIATGSTGDVVLFAKYSEIALGIYTKNIKVFNFYPNPSIDFIQTELEVSSLTIRSISGSKVKQFEGGSFFDISNLKSGVYILLAIDKNGDTYKSKLLKE